MDLFDDHIFKNDPIYMKDLVGKLVNVLTVEGESFSGVVYVIDPIYKTIVLHTKVTSDGKHDTVFILHHAMKTLEILSDKVDQSYLDPTVPVPASTESVEKKIQLKKWLEHMYINVDEVGDYLKIDDHLIIMPPYGLNNCICNNTIVLEKVRNIISLMPQEYS